MIVYIDKEDLFFLTNLVSPVDKSYGFSDTLFVNRVEIGRLFLEYFSQWLETD